MGMHGKISLVPPVILAIENAGMCGSVALVSPGQCIGEYSMHSKQTHSKRLLATAERLLRDAEVTWDDIDGLAVSLGPGSFTGLRIGLGTAKGLAMATGKPLVGVSTLSGLACQFPYQPHMICPIIDARKKEVYTAFYRCTSDGEARQESDIMVLQPAELVKKITIPTLFVGDGTLIYGDFLRDNLGDLVLIAPPETYFARAAAIGKLAVPLWQADNFLDPATAVPIYVRPSEAEINFGKPTAKKTCPGPS